MDPIGFLKAIAEFLKTAWKYRNIESVKRMGELQTENSALRAEIYALRAESLESKERLSVREKMRRGEFRLYYREGDSDPFCPTCWERDGRAIHLPPSEPWGNRVRRLCRVCHIGQYE